MRNLKHALISIITAILTLTVVYGGYTIYAETDYSFEQAFEFDSTKNMYHHEMNALFNNKIATLVSMLNDDKIDAFNDDRFLAPENDECGEDNVSTYCVAIESLDMYMAYVDSLQELKLQLPEFEDESKTIEALADILINRNDQIDVEIEQAKTVYETTLAAYNEFRLAYPMHKKYEKIIQNLSTYRLFLKRLRRNIEEFPMRFIDSTTDQCS